MGASVVAASLRFLLWSVERCLALSPLVLPSSSMAGQHTNIRGIGLARENSATKGAAMPCAVYAV